GRLLRAGCATDCGGVGCLRWCALWRSLFAPLSRNRLAAARRLWPHLRHCAARAAATFAAADLGTRPHRCRGGLVAGTAACLAAVLRPRQRQHARARTQSRAHGCTDVAVAAVHLGLCTFGLEYARPPATRCRRRDCRCALPALRPAAKPHTFSD